MRTLKHRLDNFQVTYPLENIAPMEKILFLDIETTGFTAKNASIYLIGVAYYKEDAWHIMQWFATNYEEEKEILNEFYVFSKKYAHFIHFNGNTFDLPFMKQRGAQYGLELDFSSFGGTDIYRRTAPYKEMLHMEHCKQKDIELFLGIERADRFHGGELISVYEKYVDEPSDIAFEALIQHNLDDMKGMLLITPVLAYHDLFHSAVKAKKAQANYYTDMQDNKKQELFIKINHPSPIPVPLSLSAGGCYYSGEGKAGSLRIPLYEEEMKYFYANYKDYYYLPTEDTAMHKAVAGYVDKAHRVPAQASTCYTRKYSAYLPEWEPMFQPFFKRAYAQKEIFFELTEEFKSDRALFSSYAQHVLQMLAAAAGK